jgi:hypothetical protein
VARRADHQRRGSDCGQGVKILDFRFWILDSKIGCVKCDYLLHSDDMQFLPLKKGGQEDCLGFRLDRPRAAATLCANPKNVKSKIE